MSEQAAYLILRPDLAKALDEHLTLQGRVTSAILGEFPEMAAAMEAGREKVVEVHAELRAAMERAEIS